MKEKWQGLNQREQYLVIAMALVLVVFMFYSLVWQPLNDNIKAKTEKITRQQELLVWVKEKVVFYQNSSSSGQGQSDMSLSSVINSTAQRSAISIDRLQPQGSNIQVTINEIPFTQLLTWLEQMATKNDVIVKAIDISEADSKGMVKVRRLSLSKS